MDTIEVTMAAITTTAHVVPTTTGTDTNIGTRGMRTMTPYTVLQSGETTAPMNTCEQLAFSFTWLWTKPILPILTQI